jgi:hypothetical protein
MRYGEMMSKKQKKILGVERKDCGIKSDKKKKNKFLFFFFFFFSLDSIRLVHTYSTWPYVLLQ